MLRNPFFDEDFLNRLTLNRQRETYARITALTKDELPIEFIEGKVTGGSINIDGTSAVRRTCSLTLVAKDVNINDFYWGLKNKFKLEIGLKNHIDPRYPEIIWFKQGLFIITSFSTSLNTNSFTINISGKDKMCLLNGDVSGSLPHSTDFGIEEIVDHKTGVTTYQSIPIKNIIREAVQNFGGELAHNIIINDLEDSGLMLMEYRGNSPIYMLYDIEKGVFTNIRMNGSDKCYVYNDLLEDYEGPFELNDKDNIAYKSPGLLGGEGSVVVFALSSNPVRYQVTKVEYGEIPGYKLTDLTYAGDLIANVGESLTSVLDKIKNMLGNYEYFYDIEGRFIFRKRPTYATTPWNSSETSQDIVIDPALNSQNKIFNFMNGHLITSFSNTPNILNLRNDYSVWGKYKSVSGAELPIHMRYAIDKKPTEYLPIRPVKQYIKTTSIINGIQNIEEETKYFNAPYQKPYDNSNLIEIIEEPQQISNTVTQEITNYYIKNPLTSNEYDWRELIYQMALDFRKFSHDDDFIFKLRSANPQCVYGKTGYEQYYTDMEGFWRDLYNPDPDLQYALINYTEAPNTEKLYLSGFRKLTHEEKLNATIDKASTYYVLSNAIEDIDADTGAVNTTSITLYPFKKGYCRLVDGTKYYFMTSENELNQGTDDKDLLNDVSIDLIYTEQRIGENVEYKKYIELKLQQAIMEDALYIMEEKMSLNDMDNDIKNLLSSCPENLTYKDTDNFGYTTDNADFTIKLFYYSGFYDYFTQSDDNPYWRKDVKDNPESLIFWFDFLDADGTEFGKYSVSAIGTRSKAINDNDVKAIYYREDPTMIFLGENETSYEPKTGYTYVQTPYYMENLFTVSSKGKSAKERIDELLYDHLFCTESANISAIPVYHLEPNGRIYIQDNDSGVNGEYSISKITLPLAYNGTMTLTATKATSNDMLIF